MNDRQLVQEALRQAYVDWYDQSPVSRSLSTTLLDGPLSDPEIVAAITRGVQRES